MRDQQNLLTELSGLLRPHRRLAASVVVLGFLASLSEGVGIGLFIPFLQELDVLGALAIFVAVMFKAGFAYAAVVQFSRLSACTGHELRTRVFDEVMAVDLGQVSKTGKGRLLNVLSNESWRTADAMTMLLQIVITLATMAIYIALLLLISWKATLGVTVLLMIVAAVVRIATGKIGEYGRRMTRANADVARRMVDGIDGIEVIRGYGQEDAERARFTSASDSLRRVSERSGILSGSVHPLYEILAAIVLVVVLLVTVRTPADLAPMLVFLFVLYRLAPVVRRLEQERVELKAGEGAVRETVAVISRRGKEYVASGRVKFEGLQEGIVFEDVGFRYAVDAPPALEGVNATIPARGMLAIVGPSGAGKSTLGRLLLRFADPTSGRILIDGTPLTDLDVASWRRRVAVVPQKAFLFNATVRENIAYGVGEAGDDDVISAATAAGAHDFIIDLPDGYETRLGEEGIGVSGGEAQRICLARALIRRPELLLLDEATSALDDESEHLIRRALDDMKRECAVVVIAHRTATIENADQVLELLPQATTDS